MTNEAILEKLRDLLILGQVYRGEGQEALTELGERLNGRLCMDEYQARASITAIYPPQIGLVYTVLGLAGEAGEIAENVPCQIELILLRTTLHLVVRLGKVANQVKKVFRDDGGKVTRGRKVVLLTQLNALSQGIIELAALLEEEEYFEVLPVGTGTLSSQRRNAVLSELGDALWYVSQIATETGTALDRVAYRNIQKLAARAESDTLKGDDQ